MTKKKLPANTKTTATGVIEYRELDTPDNFEDAATMICKIHQSIKQHATYGYWQIGKMVHEMQSKEGVYGNSITERVAEHLTNSGNRVSKRMVEEAHRAYNRCPDHKDIQKYIDMGIEWSQMRSINKINDDKKRKEVIKTVVDKNMTVRETDHYVKEVTSSARPAKKPVKDKKVSDRHPLGFFSNVLDHVQKGLNEVDKAEKIMEDLGELLENHSKDFEAMIRISCDENKVSDEDFGKLCTLAKNISVKSGELRDRCNMFKDSGTATGIVNLLQSTYEKLAAEITYED
jgi:hypothetical protein